MTRPFDMPVENYLRSSARAGFLLLVFLVLAFPVIWGAVKGALLAYCVFAVLLVETISRKPQFCLHRRVFLFFGVILCLNGFFVLWGMWNGAPMEGSLEASNVYVFFPLVYLFLAAATASVISVAVMIRLLLFVSILVAILTIAQSARVIGLGIMPGYSLLYYLYPGLDQDYMNAAFTGVDGYLPRATERLAFLAPFSVALLAVGRKFRLPGKLVWANFLLVLLAVALTGRRVFLLITVLAILTLLASRAVAARREVLQAITVVGMLGLLGFGIHQALEYRSAEAASRVGAISADVADDFLNLDVSIREEQLRHILAAMDRRPILGVGFGNTISTHVRDPQHPWRFELTYAALLFQTGALGVFLYGLALMQLVALAREAWQLDRDALLPFVAGMAGGLVAAATNPYLNYGTGQWILFLPVILFNVVLVAASRLQTPGVAAASVGGRYGEASF